MKKIIPIISAIYLWSFFAIADEVKNFELMTFENNENIVSKENINNLKKEIYFYITKDCLNKDIDKKTCILFEKNIIDKNLQIYKTQEKNFFSNKCLIENIINPIKDKNKMFIFDYNNCIEQSFEMLDLNTALPQFNYFFINDSQTRSNSFYYCNNKYFLKTEKINECIKEQNYQSNLFKDLFIKSSPSDLKIKKCLLESFNNQHLNFYEINNCIR